MTTAGAQRPSSAARRRGPDRAPRLRARAAGDRRAGGAIRVLYTLLEAPWPPPALDDQFYFTALPKLLADGQGFIAPFKFAFDHVSVPTAEHPPLYSVVLAGAGRCSGSTRPTPSAWPGTLFGAGRSWRSGCSAAGWRATAPG